MLEHIPQPGTASLCKAAAFLKTGSFSASVASGV